MSDEEFSDKDTFFRTNKMGFPYARSTGTLQMDLEDMEYEELELTGAVENSVLEDLVTQWAFQKAWNACQNDNANAAQAYIDCANDLKEALEDE